MNVLLVSTNREQSPQTVIPLGACLVAQALREAGHRVVLLDLCGRRDARRAMRQAVRRVAPEVIAFSLRNLDNGDFVRPHSYLPEIQTILAACPPELPRVLGGSAVSLAPAAIARELGCRYAVSGEGEQALPALLAALAAGDDPAGIPGVTVLREDGSAVTTPVQTLDRLQRLADPHLSDWLKLRRYRAFDAGYPIQCKRGCALHCSYCSYPALEGRHWRLRDPDWVGEQVRLAARSGLRTVEFVDSVFGLPQEHALACCAAIARQPERLPCCTMDLNPAACTPPLISAMKAAGFVAVGISAESADERMLHRLGKDYTAAHLRHAAACLQELPARKLWFFLLGAPGETEETLRATIRFIEELPHDHLVCITRGIRVLPGTRLQETLIREGAIPEDASLLWPTFAFSRAISLPRMDALLAECRFPNLNMMTLSDGGNRFIPLAQRLVAACRLRPPYWRYLPGFNRVRRLIGSG